MEKIAVRNLAFYVTMVFAIGFVFTLFDYGREVYLTWLVFDAEKVLHGQIWRILTTLFYPPGGFSSLNNLFSLNGIINLLFSVLLIYIYYNFASAVEQMIGEEEFNLYFFGSILIGELGTVIFYLVATKVTGLPLTVQYLPVYTHFAVFIALAILHPDARVLLFFAIPIPIKIVAYVEVGLYLYLMITSIIAGAYFTTVLVFCALLPVGIFFLRHLRASSGGDLIGRIRFRMKQRQRRKEWEDQWKD